MRKWSIEVWLLDEQGNEILPTVFEKCTYNLHPTFERNKQGKRARSLTYHHMALVGLTRAIVFKKPPFRIDEKGWGEFDMNIVLTAVGKGGEHTLEHDLNFQSERYEAKHLIVRLVARISPP